jgi:transposase
MRTHGSAEELERRRREAVALLDKGWSPQRVADELRVSRRSIDRWRQAVREGGSEAIASVPHPGRASFLSSRQQDDLVERLIAGAQSQGFDTDLWTCPRVKTLIERKYGVAYHVDHIPRLLRALGFTPQKPQRLALERDEESIEQWVQSDWLRIKKRPPGSRPTSFGKTKLAFS